MPSLPRQRAIKMAQEYWLAKPLFIDTETTGLDGSAEIVEISIIDQEGSVLLDTLVKPLRRIPQDVIRVHGITNEMVCDAPTWAEIWPQVETLLMDRYVGVYNADFDLRMMRQSHRSNGLPWQFSDRKFFCIMKLYSQFMGAYRWQKLEAAGRQCRIPLPNSHRAKDDALLARAVFQHMVSVRV
jgi:DNA polymerase III subunit epsilon